MNFLCDLSECVLKELCGQNERRRFLKFGYGRRILLFVCALNHFLSGCWVKGLLVLKDSCPLAWSLSGHS